MRAVPQIFKRVACVLVLVLAAACSPEQAPSAGGARGQSRAATAGTTSVNPTASGVAANSGSLNAGNGGGFGSDNPTAVLAQAGTISAGPVNCRGATIAFVVDGSGSMCEPFGSSTRWTELRTALLAKPDGLVYKLQGVASFGLYVYDGTIDLQLATAAPAGTTTSAGSDCATRYVFTKGAGNCPQIVEVKPAGMNAAVIDRMFPASELGGSTPTDKAMNYAVDQLIAQHAAAGANAMPQYILLATDGAPNDICVGGVGGDGLAQQMGVITAVDRAAAAGITTFVISLATDVALQMHLDEVARHGDAKDAAAHSYLPTNSAELVGTLTKLLGTAIGCPI